MNDANGVELKIGQTVVYAHKGYREARVCVEKIVGFTPAGYVHIADKEGQKSVAKKPHNMVVVPDSVPLT